MTDRQPHSILIVKTSAIGDVIQTFPVLEYLREMFPAAQIDWVAEEGIVPLLQAHPQVNNVIGIRTKVWRKAPLSLKTRKEFKAFVEKLRSTTYDVLFDLQGNTKSALVTGCAKAKIKVGFDWKSVREKSNCFVTTKRIHVAAEMNIRLKYLTLVQSYFGDTAEFFSQGIRLRINPEETQRLNQICQHSTQPYLMVCFGSKWANKRLQTSTLIAFLQRITHEYNPFFLFIFGDEQEKQIAGELTQIFNSKSLAVGNLSLPLWQALMWKMDRVIAVDSAALHLCGTTQTPSFSIFGPSSAACYKPLEERHVALQGSCPYGRTFSTRCPILRTCATGACMNQLHADDLFLSFQRGLQKAIQ